MLAYTMYIVLSDLREVIGGNKMIVGWIHRFVFHFEFPFVGYTKFAVVKRVHCTRCRAT
jgi:hypothetical protein